MRRVHQQCGAQRSTEALAQPAARRPERSEGTRPKKSLSKILVENERILTNFCIFEYAKGISKEHQSAKRH
ncbi:MAG: hypothetical protein NZ455_13300 [Bacteroidia bacterium]|nr:hypothetical protein [Bacteroidia bacterium]MDW8346831.1 hypothetical protein [Bacteroidia bacterium]